MSGRLVLLSFPSSTATTGREVRFDAAGNLYVVSTHLQLMRVFSPGGTTLAVTGGDTSGTNGTFRLVTAPAFRFNPTNQFLFPGENLKMVSYVKGMGEISYQWQLNGTNIDGATDPVYTKIGIDEADYGNYTLIASNELGMVTSSIGTVALPPAPVIQPLVVSNPNEALVSWSSVSGRTYRVQFNPDLNTTDWLDIVDVLATNSTTTITNDPAAADQRYYRVILLQP
jgi:hypothetical protein